MSRPVVVLCDAGELEEIIHEAIAQQMPPGHYPSITWTRAVARALLDGRTAAQLRGDGSR